MKETLKDLKERRSVRAYKAEQIKDEELEQVLEAGLWAPSGMGQQPVVFVAVQDPETREQLRKMNASIMGDPDMDPFYGAPTIVVVLADTGRPTYVEDGSLAMGNLMNAAQAVGLGSCWIHRAKEEFESEEGKKLLEKWGLGENYAGVGHCALGYADGEKPVAKERREGRIIRV